MNENYIFDHGPQPPDPVQFPEPPQRKDGGWRSGGWMGTLTLICSVLALILAGTALYLTLREAPEPEQPPAPPEPVTFQYRDRTLEALPDVPVSTYDQSEFYFNEAGRAIYAQDGRQARTGIDVSFYQKEIDWNAVAADGVDFAMIRLGYRGYSKGVLQMDQWFEHNIQGALDAGLAVGVYFFSQALTPEEAEEEAQFVLDAIQGYTLAYPVAFDWEFIDASKGARTNDMTGNMLTQCARAFCEKISAAGYTPAVYFNQDLAYLTYDLSQLTDYVFWLAEYGGAPDFYYDFALWQYTHTGSVAGIEGNVDLNLDLRAVTETEL